MPDISMCPTKCRKGVTCTRHQDSGTVPSPHWQTWCAFPEDTDEKPCGYYWPVLLPDAPKKSKKSAKRA